MESGIRRLASQDRRWAANLSMDKFSSKSVGMESKQLLGQGLYDYEQYFLYGLSFQQHFPGNVSCSFKGERMVFPLEM